MTLLDQEAYDRLDALSGELAAGLRHAAAVAGVAVTVTVAPGLLTLFFHPGPVRDYADARRGDGDRFARFWNAMLDRGVYLPPSPFEAWFPSLAHDEETVRRTLAAAGEALEVAASMSSNSVRLPKRVS